MAAVGLFRTAGFPAYARLRFLPDPAYPGRSKNDVHFDGDAPSDTLARLDVVPADPSQDQPRYR